MNDDTRKRTSVGSVRNRGDKGAAESSESVSMASPATTTATRGNPKSAGEAAGCRTADDAEAFHYAVASVRGAAEVAEFGSVRAVCGVLLEQARLATFAVVASDICAECMSFTARRTREPRRRLVRGIPSTSTPSSSSSSASSDAVITSTASVS